MSIKKFVNFNIVLVFFTAFSGYYSALIIINNLDIESSTRNITIPLRMIILFSIIFVFIYRHRKKMCRGLSLFIFFSSAYIIRIVVEYADVFSSFHISEIDFFLYFMAFVFFPLILISQLRLNECHYSMIFTAIMVSTFLLSLLTIVFYNDIIGEAIRISVLVKRDENYISPLALSYCATLGIGIGVIFLITNKTVRYKKVLIISTIVTFLVPFHLGASRGSIFALFIPFILYFFLTGDLLRRKYIVICIFIMTIVFTFSTIYLGSGVFDRFFRIQEDLNMGRVGRTELWKHGIIQFIDNPIFGNSLESDFKSAYPHNIIIEVLISTGIIGFIPFALFLFHIFRKIKWIIRMHSNDYWICIVFLQAFTQNMFSGGIYAASWFAIGSGLVIGYGNFGSHSPKGLKHAQKVSGS